MHATSFLGHAKRADNLIGPDGIVAVEDLFITIDGNSDDDRLQARLHEPVEFRSIFLSDVHMGTLSSCASELAQFLIHTVNTKYIYLVGDIFEEHIPRPVVAASDELFLQKLMRAARKGAKVIGIPGNHDTFLRKYARLLHIHNFIILEEAAHRTIDGRHFLVIHGDQFDALMRWPWLTVLGTRLYEWLCRASLYISRLRKTSCLNTLFGKIGFKWEWSLSQYIKSQSDQMAYSTNTNYISNMTRYLFNRNAEIYKRFYIEHTNRPRHFLPAFFDGLIGGHSHITDKKRFLSPLDKQTGKPVGPEEITYFNTGHWTGHPVSDHANIFDEQKRGQLKNPTCTAVVEYPNGRMGHVQWVPGVGIVPLTRYEEHDLGALEPSGTALAKTAPDWRTINMSPKPSFAARIGQYLLAYSYHCELHPQQWIQCMVLMYLQLI